MRTRAALGLSIVLAWTVVSAAGLRPMTVAEEMKLRPSSTSASRRTAPRRPRRCRLPSLEKNEHQAALYMVQAGGGRP